MLPAKASPTHGTSQRATRAQPFIGIRPLLRKKAALGLMLGAMLLGASGEIVQAQTPTPPPLLAPQRADARLLALTDDNRFLLITSNITVSKRGRFRSAVRTSAAFPVQGLAPGEELVGIDVRTATGQIYAVGTSNQLYELTLPISLSFPINAPLPRRLSFRNIIATPVASLTSGISGLNFGVDFNPTVDRLRVVSDADQNLRIDPNTGAVTVDGTLAYDIDTDGDGIDTGDINAGTDPSIVGSAYTNPDLDLSTGTTLYGIDSGLNTLVLQNPPNAGTLTTIGSLGVDTTEDVGFDIASTNIAYASLTAPFGTSALYTVDLFTGATRFLGSLGRVVIRDIAVLNATATTPVPLPTPPPPPPPPPPPIIIEQ